MPRLIDADKLLEQIQWLEVDPPIFHDVCEEICSQPTVDAVPVVRCKDCKYSDWWGAQGKEELDCTRLDMPHTTPDWYCAWGERREDG